MTELKGVVISVSLWGGGWLNGVLLKLFVASFVVRQIAILGGVKLAHWQERAREPTVPLAVLGGCAIGILGWGARATQFLALALLDASPVEECLSVAVTTLTGQRGVITAAAHATLE